MADAWSSSFRDTVRVFVMADHLGYAHGWTHGGTTYFLNVLPALQDAGYALKVVFLGPWHRAVRRLTEAGVEVQFLGLGKWDPRAAVAFERQLDEHQPHVVHLHSFRSHLFGRLAAHRRGIASVVHVHDQNAMPRPVRAAQRLLGPGTAALVGVSETVTRFASREYAVAPDRCHTVVHGLDLSRFMHVSAQAAAAARHELGTPAEAPLIAMVGRVIPGKGQDQLIRAMPTVLRHMPEARVWIIGDGDARPGHEALARELGVDQAVQWLGQRDDVAPLLAAAHLAVVPSMCEEGFGFVALEAMACGKPVIAYDSGALASLVDDGRTGRLVPRGDVDGLAQAIVDALHRPLWQAVAGRRAREHAKRFTLQRHVAAMGQVYRQAMRLHSPAMGVGT